MINKRGQALVEFVIILPVMILLIFGGVDFGRIVIRKNEIESLASDVVSMYKDGVSSEEITNFIKENNSKNSISITSSDKYTTIVINSSVEIVTPGLNNILGKKYEVNTKRVIYNE